MWGEEICLTLDVVALQPMKVHVSEATANLLDGSPFTLKPRGSVEVKVHFLILSYVIERSENCIWNDN